MATESPAGEEYDKLRRRVLWSMPSGLFILGTRAGDHVNGMTLNEAMQVSSEPKIIAIGVANDSLSAALVRESRIFCLNLLARQDAAVVRKFVKPVDVDLDAKTLNGFGFSTAATGAPVLDIAYAYLDCNVVGDHVAGNHTVFLGEVARAGFQLPEDTPVLRMEDTRMKYGG